GRGQRLHRQATRSAPQGRGAAGSGRGRRSSCRPPCRIRTLCRVLEWLAMLKLVLVRHGESQWNLENRFTGWTDVDLTPKGRSEALDAGRLLRDGGYTFDLAYTSVLKRAVRTLWIVLDEMDLMWVPVHRSWRLNERH